MGDGCWARTCQPWFRSACGGLDRRRDLLRLVGEDGGVQLECRFDQRDELCGWGQQLPVDLADGVSDGQVGQVHRDQVHRLAAIACSSGYRLAQRVSLPTVAGSSAGLWL